MHVQRATCNVRLLCSEEDMAEGGCDCRGPHGIFPTSKKPNLKSGRIVVVIRILRGSWARMAVLSAGAARRKLVRGAASHPIYLLSLYNHHHQLFSECKVN